uniref:FAD-dependent oxidoreductase n=1 Tax=Marinobacter sediminum TaxID=256323 RepID=UPI003561A3E7
MEKREVDVAIIGVGTAGMVAYQRVRKVTDKVVLIEANRYGTTCARVGCMPSKLLIAAADNARHMATGPLFGVSAGGINIDGKAVMKRVRQERDRFVGSVVESVDKFPDHHRMFGHARFVAPKRLMVEGANGDVREVHAERIIIATGSRPNIPGFLKEAKDRLVVNDDLFEWQDLPESVAVFGPGVIGLELGQALSRLGVRVRMFGVGGSVGPIRDESIRQYALDTFNREFPLNPEADVKQVERTESGVRITFQDDDQGEVSETFDYLLAATGRRPNVDGLDIQNAEIE